MTQEDFVKTNLATPESYETCEIHLAAFQTWDNIPTSLFLEVVLKDSGEPVHTVVRTKTQYMNVRATDAICRDIITVWRLFDRIPYPTKEIVVYVHALAAYLALTNQMHLYSNTLVGAVSKARTKFRNNPVPVRVVLGSAGLKKELRDYIHQEVLDTASVLPTLEGMGMLKTDFLRREKSKRRVLTYVQ